MKRTIFEILDFTKMLWPWKLVTGPSWSLEMSPFDTACMTNYWRSIVTMGLSWTVSEIDGDFSRKSQNFHIPVYYTPPVTGLSLELGIGARDQKLEWWGYQKKFKDSFSRLTQNRRVTARQTDSLPASHLSTAKTALTHSVARVKIMSFVSKMQKVRQKVTARKYCHCGVMLLQLGFLHVAVDNFHPSLSLFFYYSNLTVVSCRVVLWLCNAVVLWLLSGKDGTYGPP